MSTFLSRFGAHVTLVQSADRLLDREAPRVGALVATQLTEGGVDVRTGRHAVSARRGGEDTVVTLDDGTQVRVDVIVVGAGRRPRTGGLGAETAGVILDERGAVGVDASCRAAEGVWAIGDVTGIMPFTHVGMYQARVAAATLLGQSRTANYEGIPRVVFGDPEIAAVGLTADAARAAGHQVLTAELDLAESIARPWTYEKDPRGTLGAGLATPGDGGAGDGEVAFDPGGVDHVQGGILRSDRDQGRGVVGVGGFGYRQRHQHRRQPLTRFHPRQFPLPRG